MTGKRKVTLAVMAVLLLVLAVWIFHGNTVLELTQYEVTSEYLPESFSGYRIAQISDLHNAQMGEENRQLLSLLRETQPDIIVMTGDLIDSRHTDIDVALRFAKEAAGIAPCYYVTGNHEVRIAELSYLLDGLTESGVAVLRNETAILRRGTEEIALVGVDDPAFGTRLVQGEPKALPEIIPENGFTVLLSHRPEDFDDYVECGVDVAFTGHAHGGQIRLPFIGGIYAPGEGFFPEYDSGVYTSGRTNMVVSRGIGNSLFPFRVNNPPELVLVTLFSA